MAGKEPGRLAPAGPEPSGPSMGGWSHAVFEPSERDRRIVELMAAHGVPMDKVATVIVNPCTGRPIARTTLDRHFRKEIEDGRRQADAEVAESLYRQAVGRAKVIVDGEVVEEERLPVTAATIWWTKARMGWKAGGEAEQDKNATGADGPVGRVVVYLPDNGRGVGGPGGPGVERGPENGRDAGPAGGDGLAGGSRGRAKATTGAAD